MRNSENRDLNLKKLKASDGEKSLEFLIKKEKQGQ